MTGAEWIVTLVGLGLIVFELWFFLAVSSAGET